MKIFVLGGNCFDLILAAELGEVFTIWAPGCKLEINVYISTQFSKWHWEIAVTLRKGSLKSLATPPPKGLEGAFFVVEHFLEFLAG